MAGVAEKEVYDATKRGDLATVQDVLENDPYLLDGASFAYSRNLLHIATMWEQVAVVEDLLRRNPKLAEDFDSNNSSPLHIAAAKGNFQIVCMLLPVAPEMCWSRGFQGMNPIHVAAKNGHVEVLEHLLGVNPAPAMERLDRGQTVLHLCVKHGQLGALQVLVGRLGELVQAKVDDGETILHWAVRCNQIQIIYMLPVAPEMCWSLDGQGMNPIHIAAKNGHLQVMEYLLELNPSPAKERLNRGQTVLHLCVKHSQFLTFKILVEILGDLVNARDDDGETVLHWAVRCNQLEMVRYLLEKTNIFMTANNSMEYSAMGILEEMPRNDTTSQIKKVLDRSMRSSVYTLNPNSRARDAIIVVLALIATVAFQAIVSPPGGVWQDDSITHKAGEAVMAYNRPKIYKSFIIYNTIAFVASLIGILTIIPVDASIIKTTSVIALLGFITALVFVGLSYGVSLLMILRIPVTQTSDTLSKGYMISVYLFILIGFALVTFCKKRKQRH